MDTKYLAMLLLGTFVDFATAACIKSDRTYKNETFVVASIQKKIVCEKNEERLLFGCILKLIETDSDKEAKTNYKVYTNGNACDLSEGKVLKMSIRLPCCDRVLFLNECEMAGILSSKQVKVQDMTCYKPDLWYLESYETANTIETFDIKTQKFKSKKK